MNKIQDIVPVNIRPDQSRPRGPASVHSAKPKVAVRLKHGDLELTFFNGCDKYILHTALKELKVYDR